MGNIRCGLSVSFSGPGDDSSGSCHGVGGLPCPPCPLRGAPYHFRPCAERRVVDSGAQWLRCNPQGRSVRAALRRLIGRLGSGYSTRFAATPGGGVGGRGCCPPYRCLRPLAVGRLEEVPASFFTGSPHPGELYKFCRCVEDTGALLPRFAARATLRVPPHPGRAIAVNARARCARGEMATGCAGERTSRKEASRSGRAFRAQDCLSREPQQGSRCTGLVDLIRPSQGIRCGVTLRAILGDADLRARCVHP